jgi:TonB family protein
MGRFQGRSVAIDQSATVDNIKASTAHIEILQTQAEPASSYVPTADMNEHAATIAKAAAGVVQGMLLKQVPPTYPPDARHRRASGTVLLHALIGKDGHIHSLTPLTVPDPDLALAAIAAVRQWTYKPYLLNGEPVEVETTITVNFNLN